MLSKLFPTNEGTVDRILRVVFGAVALSMFVFGPKSVWGLVGIVLLTTGLIGSCPVYTLFGLRTCPTKRARA